METRPWQRLPSQVMRLWRRIPSRVIIGFILVLVVAIATFAIFPKIIHAGSGAPKLNYLAQVTNDDWPEYRHDINGTSTSPDTTYSTANATQMGLLWKYATGGGIAAQPVIANGVVYVGSWDGNEYALNAATGALIWKTFIGQTYTPNCDPQTIGVTSTAEVSNGVVYVGGGDSNWYALNANTGAVLWTVPTGDNSINGGHYNWSSPQIYNGYAYVGIASNCDIPLVQGQILKIDLSTHQIVATNNLVPNGMIGSGIWSTFTLDPETGRLFATTGTITEWSETYAQSIIAIDPNTLQVVDHWRIPVDDVGFDLDWTTSPVFFPDKNGRELVGAINKDTNMYAFDPTDLAAGPVWKTPVAVTGPCIQCGYSSASSPTYANGMIFVAGGNTSTQGGKGVIGMVRALDPTTGAILWERPETGLVVGALTYDNGLLFVGEGEYFDVINAATGDRLYSYEANPKGYWQNLTGIYAPMSVANGIVYGAALDGSIYAFHLAPLAPPPADPNCLASWTCQDIGGPLPAGSETVANGIWTLSAGGTGLSASGTDQIRYASQTVSNNMQVTAQVTAQTGPGTGQAGVMMRQSADPGSPYMAIYATSNNTLTASYRTEYGTAPITNSLTVSLPVYVGIQRQGDEFLAEYSPDGTNWLMFPGMWQPMGMPNINYQAGIFASSGTSGTAGTATIQSVAIGALGALPNPQPTAHACPSGWTCADVGDPAIVGDQTYANGVWTISGSGTNILLYDDQFHFVWQPIATDVTLSARVTSQTNTDAAAEAGVMLRANTTDPGATYYAAFIEPGAGLVVQYRSVEGQLQVQPITLPNAKVPVYLQVARSGDVFTAYTSTDGVNWTPINQSTVTIPTLSGSIVAGLAVSATNAGATAQDTFDSVSIIGSAPPPPVSCPAGWNCVDVANSIPAGFENLTNGTWTISAGGSDIWDIVDQYHYDFQSFNGDGSVSARVISQTNDNPWAKAGLMLRQTDGGQSPYYGIFVTPANGIVVQWRTTEGGTSSQVGIPSSTLPVYVKIARANGVYTAYTSTDGTNWTLFPNSTVDLSMPQTITAGLAVTSHDVTQLSTVVMDHVVLSPSSPPPPPDCPTTWNCQDIGAVGLAGDQSLNNGTWTLKGSGADIWGTSDQFHYDWQPITGDELISAHVTAQGDTDPWAKAGVMMRASTDPASPYYAVFTTPTENGGSNGIVVQYRATAGGGAAQLADITGQVPAYVKVARTGTTFTAYTSADGVNWTAIAGSSINLSAMNGQILAGLAVTSHNNTSISTVTMDTVNIATAAPPPSSCPTNWTCQDIGAVGIPGSESVSNGTWTITASGADIWGTSDQFHYDWQYEPADGAVSAHVTAQGDTDPWAKAGVMMRASTDPASPYYAVFTTPTENGGSNGIVVQYRATAGGGAAQLADITGQVPAYVKVARTGTTFTAYTSADGVNWTAIAGSTLSIPAMSGQITMGPAVTSHNNANSSTVTMDTVTLTGAAPPPVNGCASGWTCADIGNPATVGSQTYSNNTWTVQAGGTDIWGTADQFHYIWQTQPADMTISADVTAQTDTDPWAKAGVMIRLTTDPGSPYYALFVTPGNGLTVQYRSAQGGGTTQLAGVAGTVPAYLEVARSGTTFTAYTSTDGVNWTPLTGSTITLAAITGQALVGIAATAHSATNLANDSLTNVTISASAPAPPGSACPSGWACGDIGNPTIDGAQSLSNGAWTISGAGSDIWGTADQFHYVWQTVATNGAVSAQVTTQTNTDPWAKSGVMLRATTAANSAYYAAFITPGNGITIQYRDAAGDGSVQISSLGGKVPVYLKVARSGTTLTAYTSTDGVTWTAIAGSTVTLASLGGTITAGLVVCSHNAGALSTATFTNVTIG